MLMTESKEFQKVIMDCKTYDEVSKQLTLSDVYELECILEEIFLNAEELCDDHEAGYEEAYKLYRQNIIDTSNFKLNLKAGNPYRKTIK